MYIHHLLCWTTFIYHSQRPKHSSHYSDHTTKHAILYLAIIYRFLWPVYICSLHSDVIFKVIQHRSLYTSGSMGTCSVRWGSPILAAVIYLGDSSLSRFPWLNKVPCGAYGPICVPLQRGFTTTTTNLWIITTIAHYQSAWWKYRNHRHSQLTLWPFGSVMK